MEMIEDNQKVAIQIIIGIMKAFEISLNDLREETK